MGNKCEICTHSIEKEKGKYVCDISGFEVDGCHCSGCASFEDIRNLHMCESCKKLVELEEITLFGNELICQECLNNGYGE